MSLAILGSLYSCVSSPVIQPQINSLIAANRFGKAIEILNNGQNTYGPKNELLFLLDKAYVLHIAGRYQESIHCFSLAQNAIDKLYTTSLSNLASTWLVNDYMAPYRGEDFEHILVNIFQALNYAAIGNIDEALVEARDVDAHLSVLNNLYEDNEKFYTEDAFARFFMGILYETSARQQDLNDAVISYQKALKAYQSKHASYQGVEVIPEILIENLLATMDYLGFSEFHDYLAQFPDISFTKLEDKRKKGELYLIQYNGLSPIKHPSVIPLSLPGGYVSKIAFPKYDKRGYDIKYSILSALDENQKEFKAPTVLAENIESLAIESLKLRRLRVYAKAIGRPLGKYLLEQKMDKRIERNYGRTSAAVYKGLASWYNLFSEQADVRSWQTLPSEIRLARLILEPGAYKLSLSHFDSADNLLDKEDFKSINLHPGEKKFLIVRTVR